MKSIIDEVKQARPLVHHLTNEVVMNFTANGLLAFGGSPVMAKAKEEAEEMATAADAVLLNIGTIRSQDIEAMIIAGQTALKLGKPVVFDPVGVGATAFRQHAAKEILSAITPTVIKGNAAELAYLAGISREMKGVDSEIKGDEIEISERVSHTYKTIAVVTGEVDVVTGPEHQFTNQMGHHYLTSVTGAGCLLGSIIAACLTTSANEEQAVLAALQFYGMAAEQAVSKRGVTGPGTFQAAFLDSLAVSASKLEVV
ncbi:hydroxyethylthiazole kinase [Jeotgalibacillus sp. R-1-5s-1]|uniref:hydroxyethylthiazole kinase n=1 Tax=Jeotgalibacillus sp. R-1-5s-1 TaxID=2555897 RepID=UPI001069B68E|nr:hydroxyethylthiazole kinase [Jeotgalibacillus sp. R-1-5s-1]TFE00034.1 hydroxyethylthiazole kinase [Jeotgalibacillus sp. R-1-5s-1]